MRYVITPNNLVLSIGSKTITVTKENFLYEDISKVLKRDIEEEAKRFEMAKIIYPHLKDDFKALLVESYELLEEEEKELDH